MSRPTPRRLPAAALAALLVVACQSPRTGSEPREAPPAHHDEALPTLAADKPAHLQGLHNVVAYGDGLWSGAQPEGEEAFATLQRLGIRTVVSVDGAAPDVVAAERHGIRYIHLPISYDTVPAERQKQLAQVIANTKGPLYMHCHHGKHRSAAAVGAAAVVAGKCSADVATARMKVSGTAEAYTGLWAAVANAQPASAAELASDLKGLPQIATVSGLVATMAEIDLVHDLVKTAKEAKWQAPSFHPDLLASKETRRLRDLFARLADDADSKKLDAGYQTILLRAIDEVTKLDEAVRNGDAATADTLFDRVGKTCKECHKTYRDQ